VASTDDAYRLLFQKEEQEGRLYICGNRNLPKPLQEALVASYRHATLAEAAPAALQIQNLYLQGRVNQEVW
jgi:sulfite reductase alpha subunit-like flavoprotein